MQILCVEDDADSREMMTILLGEAGYEVITASGSDDALELATLEDFAVIILDNWYERGSGVELCKEIRRFDSHTPIIFYSGAAYESDIQRAMEAGAQVYLTKPTGIQVLVKTIEEMTCCTSR
jgi:DNA-binding response OmpR family regulator